MFTNNVILYTVTIKVRSDFVCSKLLLKKFKIHLKNIHKYYEKILYKIEIGKPIGNLDRWILDNFYIILEQTQIIREKLLNDENILKKRQNELYELVDTILKKQHYELDMDLFVLELDRIQKETNHYFRYSEFYYIYILCKFLLIQRFSKLTSVLFYRFENEYYYDKKFRKIDKKIERGSKVQWVRELRIGDNLKPYQIYSKVEVVLQLKALMH